MKVLQTAKLMFLTTSQNNLTLKNSSLNFIQRNNTGFLLFALCLSQSQACLPLAFHFHCHASLKFPFLSRTCSCLPALKLLFQLFRKRLECLQKPKACRLQNPGITSHGLLLFRFFLFF